MHGMCTDYAWSMHGVRVCVGNACATRGLYLEWVFRMSCKSVLPERGELNCHERDERSGECGASPEVQCCGEEGEGGQGGGRGGGE